MLLALFVMEALLNAVPDKWTWSNVIFRRSIETQNYLFQMNQLCGNEAKVNPVLSDPLRNQQWNIISAWQYLNVKLPATQVSPENERKTSSPWPKTGFLWKTDTFTTENKQMRTGYADIVSLTPARIYVYLNQRNRARFCTQNDMQAIVITVVKILCEMDCSLSSVHPNKDTEWSEATRHSVQLWYNLHKLSPVFKSLSWCC